MLVWISVHSWPHKMTFYCIFNFTPSRKERKPSVHKNTTQLIYFWKYFQMQIKQYTFPYNVHIYSMTLSPCFYWYIYFFFLSHFFWHKCNNKKRQHAGDSSTFKNTYIQIQREHSTQRFETHKDILALHLPKKKKKQQQHEINILEVVLSFLKPQNENVMNLNWAADSSTFL